jgi:hypothetical protein
MFAWGVITMGLGGTQNYAGVTAVRFILGMVEAGGCRISALVSGVNLRLI